MTIEEARRMVEKATLQIGERGLGVLVPGGFVLTSAQCIDLSEDTIAAILLDDHTRVAATAADRTELSLSIYAVELATDVAVLAAMDNQACSVESETFTEWCRRTTPVPISKRRRPHGKSFGVHVLCAGGVWRAGLGSSWGVLPSPSLSLDIKELSRNSHGGPIIDDDDGSLVGLAPYVWGEGDEDSVPLDWSTHCHNLQLALPRWVWERIDAAPFWDDDNIQAARLWLQTPTGALSEVMAIHPEHAHAIRGALTEYLETGEPAARMASIDIIETELGRLPTHTREAVRRQLIHFRLWPADYRAA